MNILKKKKVDVNRIVYLDILKIIACFLVIINHTGGYILNYSNNNNTIIFYCLNFAVCKIAVPIFIMVTGTLLLKKKKSYKQIFKKIWRIIIPLILLSFAIFAINNNIDIIVFFESVIKEPIITPYWYLYMLLSLYLITPLIEKMISNFDNRDYYYLFIICLIIPSLLEIINSLFNIEISNLFYSCLLPKTIGIYVLGYYLSNCKIRKKYRNISIMLFVIFILAFFLTLYIPYKITGEISYMFDNYNSLFAFGGGASLFYIIRAILDKKSISTMYANFIGNIGECTFGIYLFHYLITYRIFNLSFVQNLFNINYYFAIILLELTIFVIAGGFTYILRKIPYIRKYL